MSSDRPARPTPVQRVSIAISLVLGVVACGLGFIADVSGPGFNLGEYDYGQIGWIVVILILMALVIFTVATFIRQQS